MSKRRLLERVLPAVVSVSVLAWLLRDLDLEAVGSAFTPHVAAVMLPALLAYGALSLGIEAISITRVLDSSTLSPWTAARIKCASYLLGTVHYALGAGALAFLLRRRAALTLAGAAALVVLISTADLMVVLGLAGVSGALVQTDAPGVSLAVLGTTILAFAGGLALLRAPFTLGPIDRLRDLEPLQGLRTLPMRRLLELLALRVLFAGCFVAICASAFHAFDVMPSLPRLVAGVLIVAVVAALPIAVAGLGTSQAAVVFLFRDQAPAETLVALSLVLSAGMISLRAAMGILFAREYTQEALESAREGAIAEPAA